MSDEHLKSMVNLLKSGATMLQEHCSECNSPLFRVRGEVWCPNCNKRVITVKEGEEPASSFSLQIKDVERTILLKIHDCNQQIAAEKGIANLETLCTLLIKWLDALERVKKLQKL